MKRDWTEESVREWIARRDAYRERRKLPALATLRDSDDPQDRADYKTALSLERATLLERLHKYYTVTLAWPVSARAAVLRVRWEARVAHGAMDYRSRSTPSTCIRRRSRGRSTFR